MNITQLTHAYIRDDSALVDCLCRGLLNYSALAREICTRSGLDAFDAVLAACRRYPTDARSRLARERQIAGLLQSSKIVLRSKIIVATVDKPETFQRALSLQQLIRKEKGDFRLIEGEESFTIITNEKYLRTIRETFGRSVKDIGNDLVQITLVFSERLVTTIGVCAYLYRMFADHGINLREEMSCWTDIMIVIDERDMAKAMKLLSQ